MAQQRTLRTPKRAAYKPLGCLTTKPIQLIRKVWGLGRQPHAVDITIIGDDSTLMDMDAPECIPAGSMISREHRFEKDPAIYIEVRESVLVRSLDLHRGEAQP